ncbi:MAG: sensor histidine kinase, partial [Bradymonadaceae bacterium]
EKKFRNVFEQAADAMFLYHLDGASAGPFVEANEAAVSYVGVDRDQLREMTIGDVLKGPDFDLEHHLRELSDDGEPRTEALLEHVGNREPTPVEVRARCIEVDTTELVVELVRDISSRKRYQEALVGKKRAEELAELRSMFLATLSHDVRSPLAAIVTMTGLLGRQVDDEHVGLVERIERSTKQLRKILDSILRMARLDIDEALAEPEEFELVGHIEEITDVHEPLAEQKGLSLNYEGPDPPVDVRLDPQFLAQMLNNLIDNAVKFTDEGEVTVRLDLGDECVRLVVEDTGPGIPDEEAERIFERAETGPLESEEYYSEGLGLAITKQLADAMGGSVSVDSTSGEGTTFTIELPREA